MSYNSRSLKPRSLTRRNFLKAAIIVRAATFGTTAVWSIKSIAETQYAGPANRRISEDFARDLIAADDGVNLGWASESLQAALYHNATVLDFHFIDVLKFERLIRKKIKGDQSTWDWSHAIQAAIDMSEAEGLVCVTPPGILRITSPLQLGSNSKLYISPNTTILKDFDSLGTYAGTLKNKGDAKGVYNVLVFGGGEIKSKAGRIGKHIVFFNSSFITVFGIKIRNTYSDWTSKLQNCNCVLVYGNDTDVGSTDVLTDGWHFKGRSKNIVVANNYVRTGDDCIAFTQEVPIVDECGNVEDVTVVNNILDSAQSSLIKLHVRKGIDAAIRRVSIYKVKGKVGRINEGGFALYFFDESGDYRLSNVKVANLTGDCRENGDYCARVVSCRDVVIDDFQVLNSFRGFLVENSHRVRLDDINIRTLRGEGDDVSSGITIHNTDGFWITRPVVSGTKQHGIQLGAPDKPASHGVVSGGVLSGCLSTGIRLTNAQRVLVRHVTCFGNKYGIVEDPGSSRNRIVENTLMNNTAAPISLLGVDTEEERNEL